MSPRPDGTRIATLDDDDVVSLANAYHAGDRIGEKYTLVRMLGQGGMGVVWLARNVALDSDVAIKLLRAGAKSDKLERRMLKEAQAVARLGHPAILRVFDFGTTERSDPYMVMELLDGEDLGQTLERNGRLSPIKAVRTLLPILHALGTAHQKGIVHRDLKPENIFLTSTDSGHMQPKVVDFGIVKTEVPEIDRLTHLGTVLGTPAYLCPEQARGDDVDQRADVWSAAVVLYEMVTCRLPFEGSNYNALMRSIIDDVPPAISNFGAGDAELWSIIERGLAKRAADRWPNMSAFGGALANWLLARGESDDISGASLRAAWQQGPTAARPEDLYSARPNLEGRAPDAPDPRRVAHGDTITDASLSRAAGHGAGAPVSRQRWLAAAAAAALLVGAAVVASRSAPPVASPLAPPAAPASAAPLAAPAVSPAPSVPRGDQAVQLLAHEAPRETPLAGFPVRKLEVPQGVTSSEEPPAPRAASKTSKARAPARAPGAAPPEDLKTTL